MRKFLISTIERRAGANFNLKDVGGRNVIANMTINPSTARHEAWIFEADFLKFSKDLALLGRTPGCAVHVLKIEDTEPQIPRIPAFMDFIAGYNIALDLHPLPDEASTAARAGYSLGLEEARRPEGSKLVISTLSPDSEPWNSEPKVEQPPVTQTELDALAKVPFLSLKKIAKTEGVSLEGLDKGSRALAAAILTKRQSLIAAT